MYLSRVLLDISNRNTLKALASPSIFHGAISSSFQGERPDVLWRIDSLSGNLFMLILSKDEPELTNFCKQFSNKTEWETRNYDQLIERLENEDIWRFRMTANPTKSVKTKDDKRGKVTAHITALHQKNWLIEKGKTHGFELLTDSFDVVQSKWYRFYKQGNKYVTLLSVTYEGLLKVTDKKAFKDALISGIGRGKAYGMGMMTVMGAKR